MGHLQRLLSVLWLGVASARTLPVTGIDDMTPQQAISGLLGITHLPRVGGFTFYRRGGGEDGQ